MKKLENSYNILIYGLIVFAFSLRIYGIGSNCYTGDEVRVLSFARMIFLDSKVIFSWDDGHPPLYKILLAGWIRFFGTDEPSTRMLSIIFGTLSLWFIYLIGKALGGKEVGLTSLYLGGISPFLILFSRITRSFPCFLFFNLSSLWFFWLAIKNENRLWVYIISTILSLYAGTFGVITLICEWIWLVLNSKSINKKKWTISQVIIILAVSFWVIRLYSIVPSVLSQFSRVPTIFGIPGKIGYLIFSFSVGQSILPWDFKITIPGLFVFIFGAIHGLRVLMKKRWNKEFLFLLIFIFIPLLPICTNIDFPHYYLQIAPLYYILIGIGITQMGRLARVIILLLITVVNGYGVCNIYFNRNYHLQQFTDNWREVATFVKAITSEEDKIIAYHKSFLWYYTLPNLIALDIRNPENTETQLLMSKKIVFIHTPQSGTFSSDDAGIYKFKDWLDHNFLCTQSVGFSENENYEFKRKLLNRSFPRFRIEVFIYERK